MTDQKESKNTPNQGASPEKSKIRTFAVVYGVLLLLLLLLINLEGVNQFVSSLLALLRPILWGLVLSYLVNPMFRFFERRCLERLRHLGLRRALALILAYLAFFLIIALVLALILPQLIQSLSKFFTDFESYLYTAVESYNRAVGAVVEGLEAIGIHQGLIKPIQSDSVSLEVLLDNIDEILAWIRHFVNPNGGVSVIGIVSDLFSGITDLVFAFFVSVYLLSTKERRYAQIMKMRHALFNATTNAFITKACTVADRCFGSFIIGKLVESALITLMAYLSFLIFGIPYPLLIAAIGGIANVIPFVGPILGVIPALVIVLLAAPSKALTMVLIVFIIQRLDKNLINPRMFDRYNIRSLTVLIALTTVGFAWGLAGLLLCVPLFATVLALLDESIERRLRRAGMLSAVENYYPADSVVDPARDVLHTSDTTIKRLERRILAIRAKRSREQSLTAAERTTERLYHTLIRLRLIPELSNEIRMQINAEQAEATAARETEELIRRMQGVDLLEKQ